MYVGAPGPPFWTTLGSDREVSLGGSRAGDMSFESELHAGGGIPTYRVELHVALWARDMRVSAIRRG